ncbi:MAG: hypothetical protein Q8M16_12340 [Pirellulaceae bacterium]|nr:hypothetical protein [Pirellulaceae bacterium]
MKTDVYCPYCAAELFDPDAERCTSCGMFVAPELRATIAAKIPVAPRQVPRSAPHDSTSLFETTDSLETIPVGIPVGIPIAVAASDLAPPELGRPWYESSFNETQQAKAVWQTIFLQSSIGWALWGWAIIPLGRMGYMPYTWFPAGLAVVAGLLGLTEKTRWLSLGTMLAAIGSMIIAGLFS